MKLNQIHECFRLSRASHQSGLTAIDTRSTSSAHSSASLRRRNVSLTYFPFRLTWTRQDPDFSFVNVAKTCALRVH